MRAQFVPTWLDGEVGQADIPLFDRLLDRLQCCCAFAEPNPRQGTMKWWNIVALALLFEVSQHAPCLRAMP